jgi:hypothetical protein
MVFLTVAPTDPWGGGGGHDFYKLNSALCLEAYM